MDYLLPTTSELRLFNTAFDFLGLGAYAQSLLQVIGILVLTLVTGVANSLGQIGSLFFPQATTSPPGITFTTLAPFIPTIAPTPAPVTTTTMAGPLAFLDCGVAACEPEDVVFSQPDFVGTLEECCALCPSPSLCQILLPLGESDTCFCFETCGPGPPIEFPLGTAGRPCP